MNYFFLSLNLDLEAKINDRLVRLFLSLSPLLLISLLPPPFQVALDQMYASYAYPGRTVPTEFK